MNGRFHILLVVILWRRNTLLRAVSGRQIGIHVPEATNTHATIVLEKGCFYVVRADVISKGQR
jgi:hypothetical protein